MTLFALLLAAFALLHLPGLRRWPGGPRPADRAAGALGLVLLVPGWQHFAQPDRFKAMLPPWLPTPDAVVHLSGMAELAIAGALLVPELRRWAGWCAVALFLSVWPANVHVALRDSYPPSLPQSDLYHALRIPFQLLYVGWAAWVALGHLPGRDLRRRGMARLYDRVIAAHDEWTRPLRRQLLRDARGTVLELGPGTGANFAYLTPDVRWIGLEPNRHMHAQLRERAAAHGFDDLDLRTVGAEGMEVPDASVDVVVCTLVLCSVPDPSTVLAGVRRVLRPGGRLLFLEHVAAPRGSGARRVQRLLRPLWQFVADGCTLDRDLVAAIGEAGFADVTLRTLDAPRSVAPRFVAAHIVGTAREGGATE